MLVAGIPLHNASLSAGLISFHERTRLPPNEDPAFPVFTITCPNDENISRTANYGLYPIAAAGHQ